MLKHYFAILLMASLGVGALIDSMVSYKRGVFREYRRMAPSVFHYKGKRSFLPQVIGNAFVGMLLIGAAFWIWFKM
ncbi:hypothetical protein B9Z99_003955 [Klebsiella aerogenes]|nr:hypothetical protein B9Z99_003955 [Klebsiella aerogenes]